MKEILHGYRNEIVVYLTAAVLLLAAYLIIGKLMPLVMQCRVIIN